MEVIAAVMIGALLWLIGPGRKFWLLAGGTAGEREARRTLHSSAAGRRASSAPPPLAATRSVPAESTARRASPAPSAAPPPTPDLKQVQRSPITLGVALLLQTLAFVAISALIGVGYVGLQWKARADARAVERRLAERLTTLETTLANSQRSLETIEAALAAQARTLERIDARLSELAPPPRPDAKAGRAGKHSP